MRKYLPQRLDWPNFYFDEAAILPLLARISHRHGRFLGHMETLGLDARNRAQVIAVTEEVIKTSAIEGENLSRDQVRSSVLRQLGVMLPGCRHRIGRSMAWFT